MAYSARDYGRVPLSAHRGLVGGKRAHAMRPYRSTRRFSPFPLPAGGRGLGG